MEIFLYLLIWATVSLIVVLPIAKFAGFSNND